uniref:Transmembrane protein 44 n=1 Tax=Poecilia reticulata TaxID=8081 RepID=A0A3P9NH68_POERE
MDGGVSTAEDELRGSSDHFLTSLRAFWLHSVASCGSPDAAHLCVSAGLALLSAVLLLISSLFRCYRFRTACQKSKLRGEYSEQTIVVFYSFLGNLCSTVGAVLSRQLHLQISMAAFAALMDAVHCILCCLPLFLCWNSKTRKLRAAKRRRRQHFLAVGVLMVVAGGFLKSRVDEPITIRSITQMLITFLIIPKDSKEILGYILGLLASVIAWTSRFPALCRAVRDGQNLTPTFIVSGFLCSVSGALYAAAILLQDVRFGFLIRVVPWLLSSIGCVILDLLVSFFSQGFLFLFSQLLSLNKEVTLSKDGLEVGPPHRMVHVVRVDGLCSSDTSYSSTSDSTDLEVGGNLDQK